MLPPLYKHKEKGNKRKQEFYLGILYPRFIFIESSQDIVNLDISSRYWQSLTIKTSLRILKVLYIAFANPKQNLNSKISSIFHEARF